MNQPLEINVSASSVVLDTRSCFQDPPIPNASRAPIDMYWDNTQIMNTLIGQIPSIPIIGLLILLGSVSAVESYFRTLFCKIITLDKDAEKKCLGHSLAYGAVISSVKHSKKEENISEALLEGCSFASKKNIKDSLKNFIGIKGNLPNELEQTLDDFEKVCHLRHCAVHRFGMLGTKNAISLDFDTHSSNVGNSIELGVDEVDKIVGICTNVVKVINNYLFEKLLQRTVENNSISWKWDLRSDKKYFMKYYKMFYSIQFSNENRFSLKNIYNKFRDKNSNV